MRCRQRNAFSLVEATVSVAIVGFLIVASMNAAGSAVKGRFDNAHKLQGEAMAHDLLAEILRLPYQDPDPGPVFGPESDEVGSTRAAYDDVDDYHGWDSADLQRKDGSAIQATTGWRRTVVVTWADAANPDEASLTETQIKRIHVRVEFNERPMGEAVGLRTGVGDIVVTNPGRGLTPGGGLTELPAIEPTE